MAILLSSHSSGTTPIRHSQQRSLTQGRSVHSGNPSSVGDIPEWFPPVPIFKDHTSAKRHRLVPKIEGDRDVTRGGSTVDLESYTIAVITCVESLLPLSTLFQVNH